MSSPSAPAAALFDVLVLVAPVGTPEATLAVLAELPPTLPVAVLIMSPQEKPLEDLRRLSLLPMREAEDGAVLESGSIYVAPPRQVLTIRPGLRCALTPQDDRPSPPPIDQLLGSLALSAGSRALVVILGSEGQDGVAGARALRGVGGTVLVQRPEEVTEAALPTLLLQTATLVLSPATLARVVADLLRRRLNGHEGPYQAVPSFEITERRHREANQALLVEISRDLSQLASEKELCHTVGLKLAAHLGLTCYHYVDVDEDRAEVTVLHFWHALDVPEILGTYPIAGFIAPDRLGGLRAGETTIIHDVQNELQEDSPAAAGLREGATAQKTSAYVAVPYSQDGRWKAYFAVADSQPRRWTELEVRLIQDIAGQLSPRIERLRVQAALRASEAQYRLAEEATNSLSYTWNLEALHVTPSGLTSSSAPGGIRESLGPLTPTYSDGFSRVLGYSPGEVPLTWAAWQALIHPDDLERVLAGYGRPFLPGHSSIEYRLHHRDGHYLYVLDHGVVIHDEQGRIRRLTGSVTDITERRRAEEALREGKERQMFLLRLSETLRAEPDVNAVADRALRLLLEQLSLDRCSIAEYQPEEDWADLTHQVGNGRVPPLPNGVRLSDFPEALQVMLDRTLVIEDVTHTPGLSDLDRKNMNRLGMGALVAATLRRGEGRPLRCIFAVSASARPWTSGEIALIEESTERTWAAMEQAREEMLRRQAEELNAFLVRFTDTVRRFTDPQAVAETACRLIAERLGVEHAYWTEVDWATREHIITASVHTPGVPVPVIESRFPVGDWEPLASLQRAGLPVVVDDTQEDIRLPPEVKAGYVQIAVGADLSVPVTIDEKLRCALAVNQRLPRHWSEGEIALVQGLVGRCWSEVERARAEETRRVSEARFRAVANLVPDLLWESEPDGLTPWYNQRWLDYTGQTFEQATGWGWTDAIHPDDRQGSARRYSQAVQSGQPLRQEHRIRRHDGEYRWFVVNAFPLRDERSEVNRVYGAATDIHHLREKSAVLEARVEERTHQLAELNAEFESRNRALEAFAELTRSLALHLDPYALIQRGQEVALSLLPEGFATYYEPEGSLWRLRTQVGDMRNPALQAIVEAGLNRGDIPSLDRPWKSGSPFFQGHYAPDTDGLGALEHGTNAVATLPLTVGGRQVGVFAVALFGKRAWSGADRAMLEMVVRNLGLALERAEAVRTLAEEREALGTFAQFAEQANELQEVPALAQYATAVLQQVLSPGNTVYLEREGEVWRLRHASGQLDPELEAALRGGVPAALPGFEVSFGRREPVFFEHWDPGELAPPVHFTAIATYPLFPQDHPAGMLSMALMDRPAWTEREKAVFRAVGDSFRLAIERTSQLQQIGRQRERLADLNAELGNLITRTAHNLEAPAQKLSHLLGPGPAGGAQPFDGLSPYDPALLQEEIARLKGVAEDLRHLAHLEVRPLSAALLPLGEVFAEVRAALPHFPGRPVAWQVARLPIVRGDRALLRQALEVLMTFTLSATRGAGYVTVDSAVVGGEVQITVEDDGVGLVAEEAATLFDLVVRTDQGVPVLEGGGLIQVRRILARHGGWAWAEARSTGGKVVLTFPQDEKVGELEALFGDDLPGV